ncbi:hypothetical protein ABDK00_001960 [Niabella insulamsoli]|uniref:hypothetical protein n=1 Tax=Niabella insulamsoli TaxID=3144874 RepID=UPI0031FD4B65
MTGIFKHKTPGNIILLCVLAVLIKLPAFFHETGFILKHSDGPLFVGLINWLKGFWGDRPVLLAISALVINISIASALTNFLNTERLVHKPNFLAGMSYILITSLLPSFNLLSSNLIASLLLFSAFALFYRSQHRRNNIFNAAFLTGLASLFFPPAVLFVFWAFLALAVIRPFKPAEWIGLVLGLLAPYYFYAAYLFLNDQTSIPAYLYHLSFLSSSIAYSGWHALALFFLLAPLFAGIYYMQIGASKMLTQVKKGWYLLLAYLVTAIIVALFDIEKTSENMVLTLVPIAAFHGYGYLNAELRLFPKISFWLTVAFIISNQIWGHLW